MTKKSKEEIKEIEDSLYNREQSYSIYFTWNMAEKPLLWNKWYTNYRKLWSAKYYFSSKWFLRNQPDERPWYVWDDIRERMVYRSWIPDDQQ
tara:strand:+ start:93 stop:368 length:276 start_codon:yes stop_codon:yes gene_type:complete